MVVPAPTHATPHLNRYASLLLLLISITVIVSMSLVLYTSSTTSHHRIMVGTQDTMWVNGFHSEETSTDTNQSFRWSKEMSTIHIPLIHQGWNTVTLYALGSPSRNQGQEVGTDVAITIATNTPVTFTLSAVHRRYVTLLVPPSATTWWYTPMSLASSTIVDSATGRQVGIALLQVIARATILHTALPYSLLVCWGIGLIACVVLRLHGLSWVHSLCYSALVTSGVMLIYMQHSIALLPHLHWLGLWCGLWVCGIIVARMAGIVTATHTVPGSAFPIFCAVALWLLPMMQMVLIHDNVYIKSFRYQSWMGVALVAILGGGTLCYWLQRRLLQRIPDASAYWYMLIGFAVLGMWYHQYDMQRLFINSSGDFEIFLAAARSGVNHGPIYNLDAIALNPWSTYFRPPFYVLLFMPFVQYETLFLLNIFRVCNIILIIGALYTWISMHRPHYAWWLVVVTIVLNYQPLFDTLAYGQTDVILFVGFTFILYAIRTQRDGAAGIVLALLTMLKLYPIFLVAFFVIKQRWSVLIGFAIGIIICNGLSLAFLGWDTHIQYLVSVLPNASGTTSWIENQSISGFVARWYDTPFATMRFTIAPIAQIASICAYLVCAVVCLVAVRDTPAHTSIFALQYGLFIILMVVAIPAAWMHYTTMLIVVFLIVFWHYRDQSVHLVMASIYALGFALIAFGDYRSFNYRVDYGLVTTMMSSYKLYGMLLLLGAICYDVWRHTTTWSHAWMTVWQKLRQYNTLP